MIRNNLANYVTCLNLLCGCLSVLYSLRIDLQMAAIFIILAGVFDFFDGFVARLSNSKSIIGKDLDSLADVVSFGVAPGFIVFALFFFNFRFVGIDYDPFKNLYALSAFLLPVCAAWRLAKFNNDTRQTDGFIGMPVPSMGYIVAGLPFIIYQGNTPEWLSDFLLHPVSLIFLIVLLCYLMLSEIPLLSLKFKTYGFKENMPRYLIVISGALLLAFLQLKAMPLIIISFIVISLFNRKEEVQ